MFFSKLGDFSKFSLHFRSCHPERSEGSQRRTNRVATDVEILRAAKLAALSNDSRDSTVEVIPRRRPPRFPPAFRAQSACSLPPCSSRAGSHRKILRVPAQLFPTALCWSRKYAFAPHLSGSHPP